MAWSLEGYFQGATEKYSSEDRPAEKPKDDLKFGWKYLAVRGGKFHSPLYQTVMETNQEMWAECPKGHGVEEVPEKYCGCGFHLAPTADSSVLTGYKTNSTISYYIGYGDESPQRENILALFIPSGRIVVQERGFRAQRVLFVGVATSDPDIIDKHPYLLTAPTATELKVKVREAYKNGYWSGHGRVRGSAGTSRTISYPGTGYGYYLKTGTNRTSVGYTSSTNIGSGVSHSGGQTNLRYNSIAYQIPVVHGDQFDVSDINGKVHRVVVPENVTELMGSYAADNYTAVLFKMADGTTHTHIVC